MGLIPAAIGPWPGREQGQVTRRERSTRDGWEALPRWGHWCECQDGQSHVTGCLLLEHWGVRDCSSSQNDAINTEKHLFWRSPTYVSLQTCRCRAFAQGSPAWQTAAVLRDTHKWDKTWNVSRKMWNFFAIFQTLVFTIAAKRRIYRVISERREPQMEVTPHLAGMRRRKKSLPGSS